MKVKVNRLSIDSTDTRLQGGRYIGNSNAIGWLKSGSEYWVYGIRISVECMYAYIYSGRHLVEVPFELFSIIDSSKSLDFEVRVRDNGDITMRPPLFYEEDFIENFSEYEEEERSAFELLRAMVEQ